MATNFLQAANCESINCYDKFNAAEIDGALLLSQLLDESLVDQDCDDERLTSVIRSLEAEIIEPPASAMDQDAFMELEWDDNFVNICNYIPEDVMDGQDCSTSSSESDEYFIDNYNWMDMENMVDQFEGVGDHDYYNHPQYIADNYTNFVVSSLEELSYGSLWQHTNVY